MSTIESHADAFLALLVGAGLTVYDGKVGHRVDGVLEDPADEYVMVRSDRQLPTGVVEPDKVPFSGRSAVTVAQFYCYSVGRTEAAARAISGQVEAAVLDVVPVIAGRTCFPIRWTDGSSTPVDEETLRGVHEVVDIYSLTTTG